MADGYDKMYAACVDTETVAMTYASVFSCRYNGLLQVSRQLCGQFVHRCSICGPVREQDPEEYVLFARRVQAMRAPDPAFFEIDCPRLVMRKKKRHGKER